MFASISATPVRILVSTSLLLASAALFSQLSGCGKTIDAPVVTTNPTSGGSGTEDGLPTDDEIRRQIDEVLDFTYERRRLNLQDHAAWQILHGALAYKRQFLVSDNGNDVSAVDHVLKGGKMTGWNMTRGDLLDEATQRYGVKALLESGTKTGQGHTDQWLGYLSDCQLPLDEVMIVEGKEHTVRDYVEQIEHDVHLNPYREYSWTLMALTAYRPTSYEWKAGDGSTWNIGKLVEIELEHNLDQSPCGGTHRLVGLTIARNRHVEAGGKLEGVWKACDDKINESIAKAKQFQNPDGSLSSNYLQRIGNSADLAQAMGSAGHVMEFLAVSMDKDQLQEPWVKRAVLKVCETFRNTKPVDVECGALFHAAHGLVLYRQKVFGPRSFGPETSEKPAAAAADNAPVDEKSTGTETPAAVVKSEEVAE